MSKEKYMDDLAKYVQEKWERNQKEIPIFKKLLKEERKRIHKLTEKYAANK